MATASTFTQEAAAPRRAMSETALRLETPHTASLNPRHVDRVAFGSGAYGGHLIGWETRENRRSFRGEIPRKEKGPDLFREIWCYALPGRRIGAWEWIGEFRLRGRLHGSCLEEGVSTRQWTAACAYPEADETADSQSRIIKGKQIIVQIRSDGRVGLRRQIKALVRKGVGSNPTLVKLFFDFDD